jgi:hypothetical protein
MKLWKENSPATVASCGTLESIAAIDSTAMELLPMPPPAYHFLSSEAALNIALYNAHLGCTMALLSVTDPDPAIRELEAYNLVYQNIRIAAGLLEGCKGQCDGFYKPCDAISLGITAPLYQGARRCFSLAWQRHTIDLLRSIGREGLSDGLTLANTLEMMCQLEAKMLPDILDYEGNISGSSYLGPLCDRVVPLLLPRGVDGQLVAVYLRYRNTTGAGNELAIQVVAKATWKEDIIGSVKSMKLDVYDPAVTEGLRRQYSPQALDLFDSWRQKVRSGWHGYLGAEVQEGFLLRKKRSSNTGIRD